MSTGSLMRRSIWALAAIAAEANTREKIRQNRVVCFISLNIPVEIINFFTIE
jgi:hypothetical protein